MAAACMCWNADCKIESAVGASHVEVSKPHRR